MKKKVAQDQPMWFQTRKWGLVAGHPKTKRSIGWVYPAPDNDQEWLFREPATVPERFRTHTLARNHGEKVLGDKVKWYFYRVDGAGRGKGKPRSDR